MNHAHLLQAAVDRWASELVLCPGSQPLIRVGEALQPLPDSPSYEAEGTAAVLGPLLTRGHRATLESQGHVLLELSVKRLPRFEVQVLVTTDGLAAVFKRAPWDVLGCRELGLPEAVVAFAEAPRGLILVTGPPASGVTTTEAALVDHFSGTRHDLVVIAEPTEWLPYRRGKALITRLNVDWRLVSVADFVPVLTRVDPGLVVLRDIDTVDAMECALELARCGTLVLATMRASSAVDALRRLVIRCPSLHHHAGRSSLASDLVGVAWQCLVPRAVGQSVQLAMEVLVPEPAVRRSIREGRFEEIPPHLLSRPDGAGSRSLDHALATLFATRLIPLGVAEAACHDPQELYRRIDRIQRSRLDLVRDVRRRRRVHRWARRRAAPAHPDRDRGPYVRRTPPRLRINLLRHEPRPGGRLSLPADLVRAVRHHFSRRWEPRLPAPKVRPWHGRHG